MPFWRTVRISASKCRTGRKLTQNSPVRRIFASVCVLAGSLAVRPKVATSAGTLSTSNALFVFLLVLMVLLIGALTMFPALALGPVAEQLMMVL